MSFNGSAGMGVSVIIPARNAAATLGETLDSLEAQTWTGWEALLVDDGSTDGTRAIAEARAAADPRVRVLAGPGRGAGAARNAGLAAAGGLWVLFLDADDTVAPDMLERMIARADLEGGAADAVHCGWAYTDPEGRVIGSGRCLEEGFDLFPVFARYNALAIHACLVRREVLARAGGFDEALAVCEDFDLWQRVARLGARFVPLAAELCAYRLRPRASWFDPDRFLQDALTVVRRGHGPDPRLPAQAVSERHRDGAPAAEQPGAEVQMVVWAAAMAIAQGGDARPLLDRLEGPAPLAEAEAVADSLHRGLPLALCRPFAAWAELWPEVEGRVVSFLDALEARSGVAALAARTRRRLETRILSALPPGAPREDGWRVGLTAGPCIEATQAVADLILPGAERAIVSVLNHGHHFGAVPLPVMGGLIPAAVLADAVGAAFAWPLLDSLLSAQVYPGLRVERSEAGWEVARGDLTLAYGLDADPRATGRLHDDVGWTVFVQELAGLADWSIERLYDPAQEQPEALSAPVRTVDGVVTVEASMPLPELVALEASGPIAVEVTLGGAPVLLTLIEPEAGRIAPGRLRAAILDRGKMELARVAAREACVGWTGDLGLSLRERLRARAEARGEREHGAEPVRVVGGGIDPERATRALPDLGALGGGPLGLVGARVEGGAAEGGRRAVLPVAATGLPEVGLRPGQPALALGQGEPALALVLPEVMALGHGSPANGDAAAADPADPLRYDRHFFEKLFVSGADPWAYNHPYEQTKYEQTLSLIPRRVGRALEVGCAEGHFTRQLAPRTRSLLATDFSDLALARTAARCADQPQVSFRRIDLRHDPLPGGFDLIVCSELLYYMGDLDELGAVATKLAGALAPGGRLVTAHANLVVDEPAATGFDWAMPYGAVRIGQALAAAPGLLFEAELRTPLYRVQAFRKPGGLLDALLRPARRSRSSGPRRVVEARHAEPSEEVGQHVLWGGGVPAPAPKPAQTFHLPILMYHAVDEAGPEALGRWRVTPAQLDAQLGYLRQAGFKPASLAEWRAARAAHRPLEGRRVAVTFDDGYEGFEETVLPILRRHAVPATLFVPAGHVGGAAEWDAWAGPARPLVGWDALRRLREAGVAIGGHGWSHRTLDALSPTEMAEELWRSRARIEAELGVEVDALAYPSGATDAIVEAVAAACGYRHGLTTADAPSALGERDLALSRVEVRGDMSLPDFIARLPE